VNEDNVWLSVRVAMGLLAALLFAIAGHSLRGTEGAEGFGWAAYGAAALSVALAVPAPHRRQERPAPPADGTPAACPECGKATLRETLAYHLVGAHRWDAARAERAARE
jgi:hypothetical protein